MVFSHLLNGPSDYVLGDIFNVCNFDIIKNDDSYYTFNSPTCTRIQWNLLPRLTYEAWVLMDMGEDYFKTNFTMEWYSKWEVGLDKAMAGICCFGNIAGFTIEALKVANEGLVVAFDGLFGARTRLVDYYEDDLQVSTYEVGYYRLVRAGTTATLTIHSDPERTILLDTLVADCLATTYRYFGCCSGAGYPGETDKSNGYSENFKLTVNESI